MRRMGLVSAHSEYRLQPLDGGVSSDIVKVETSQGATFCVKRALARLKVAGDWQAPVSRNRAEVAWLRFVGDRFPGRAPALLGDDPEGGAFAMAWLDPATHPVWKARLRDGHIVAAEAAAVGALLGRIHAASAGRDEVIRDFDNDAIFYPIRLEPYLVATGRAHPDLAHRFTALVATTQSSKHVLVHGDYSPKNILVGPDGPVVLDAECAWYGDPAFDLAFVANHLLLKGVWRPQWRARYLEGLAALVDAYRAHAVWEPWPVLEARVAALLPALLLARVDGKSPAEYITTDADRDAIRRFARPRIAQPPPTIAAIARDWSEA